MSEESPDTPDPPQDDTPSGTREEHLDRAVAELEGPIYETAVAALEQLSDTVELLSDPKGEALDGLGELAGALKATAEQILELILPDDFKEEPGQTPSGLEAQLASTREMLAGVKDALSGRAQAPEAPAETEPPPAETQQDEAPALRETLTQLASSLGALTRMVQAQHARLAKVEGYVGVPNSRSPEPVVKARGADDDRVGWPMDLNKPMDRESVDKAVSFHDP